MEDALRAAGTPVTEYMSETKIAAMWEDAGVNFAQEREILKHLRQQFGKKTFATRKKVDMLGDGHTKQ